MSLGNDYIGYTGLEYREKFCHPCKNFCICKVADYIDKMPTEIQIWRCDAYENSDASQTTNRAERPEA